MLCLHIEVGLGALFPKKKNPKNQQNTKKTSNHAPYKNTWWNLLICEV